MEFYTKEQIEKELRSQALGVVWLENENRMQLIAPQVPGRGNVDQHLKKIFTRINSPASPDGIYYVIARASVRSKAEAMTFPVRKGKLSENNGVAVVSSAPSEKMSWAEMLKLFSDNAKLQGENESLKNEVANLRGQISTLNEVVNDLRMQNNDLSENGKEPAAPMFKPIDLNVTLPPLFSMLGEIIKPKSNLSEGESIKLIKQELAQTKDNQVKIAKVLNELLKLQEKNLQEPGEEETEEVEIELSEEEDKIFQTLNPEEQEAFLQGKAALINS